ncbi:hypothetical protein ID866_9396 [Astraeus odoratus]|nr:hypothetical protein ID866_9396 [Astraeus odoratus]
MECPCQSVYVFGPVDAFALTFQTFIIKSSAHAPASNVGSCRIVASEGHPASITGMSFNWLVLFALWNACDDIRMAEVFVDRR